MNISIISLVTEFHKYIVIFDLVTFLGFSNQFILRFKKFTNFITLLIKIICIVHLLIIFSSNILLIIKLDSQEFYDYF